MADNEETVSDKAARQELADASNHRACGQTLAAAECERVRARLHAVIEVAEADCDRLKAIVWLKDLIEQVEAEYPIDLLVIRFAGDSSSDGYF